jgi:hypothetical protein
MKTLRNSFVLLWTVAALGSALLKAAAGIVQQPRSQMPYVGDSVTFSVIATGAPPLSLQWLFNETALPNKTNSSLSLQPVGFSDAGAYWVVVSNADGVITSERAWLSVLPTNVVNLGDRELQFDALSGPIWWAPLKDDAGQSITGDGLTLYYESRMPGGSGDVDLWMVTRSTRNSTNWSAPVNLGTNVNSRYHDGGPVLSPDRLSLYFDSTRPGGSGLHDIWVATRAKVDAPFGVATNLGPTINSPYDDGGAHLSADNLTMVFTSNRPGGLGNLDVWMSVRTNVAERWEPARHLPAPINYPSANTFPVEISHDGLVMFFKSDRPIKQGANAAAMFITKRPGKDKPFGPPLLIQPILTTGGAGVDFSSLSDDGKTFWVGTYQTIYPDWPVMYQMGITELPQLSLTRNVSTGNFEVGLLGRQGATYEIEVSTDLKVWQSLLTTNTTDWISLSDPGSTIEALRFYRALSH